VLLIDLDKFKSVNDRFGHAVGDQVLRLFAETFSAAVRPSDVVGRLGGEEFGAVLLNVGRERALAIAERVRSKFAEAARVVEGRPVGATVSVGLALSEQAALDLVDLLGQADQALYRAKDLGRNRTEIAEPDRRPWRAEARARDAMATSAARTAA